MLVESNRDAVQGSPLIHRVIVHRFCAASSTVTRPTFGDIGSPCSIALSRARDAARDRQTCDNQLFELRHYAEAHNWTIREYVDTGISDSNYRRPPLDQLMADIDARRVNAVACWHLDRFGRNLRHLVVTIEELTAAGVAFVGMGENIDTSSPTGRLMLGIFGSFAEFERERIRERIVAGLAKARRQGTNSAGADGGSPSGIWSAAQACQCGRRRRRSVFPSAAFAESAPACFRIMASSSRGLRRKPRSIRLRCSRSASIVFDTTTDNRSSEMLAVAENGVHERVDLQIDPRTRTRNEMNRAKFIVAILVVRQHRFEAMRLK